MGLIKPMRRGVRTGVKTMPIPVEASRRAVSFLGSSTTMLGLMWYLWNRFRAIIPMPCSGTSTIKSQFLMRLGFR